MTRSAAVFGSGWGAHAARALSRHPGVELRCLVGRGSDRSRALAAELAVPLRPELEGDVDLAVVAVSERVHLELVEPLLARGIHVLVTHPVYPRAEEVAHLAEVADGAGAVVRTDDTFRPRPELAALKATPDRGALLRVSIESPGRWLPIALDVAVCLAGPVHIVHANPAYPRAVAARARRAPHAFVPSAVLTHRTGTVTTIVPVPHAPPAEPVRVCASYERGRVTTTLPRGGAEWLALRAQGEVETRTLVEASADPLDATVHARGMEELVSRFVDTLDEGAAALTSLADEQHLRSVWAALWRATRDRAGADVGA